MYCSNCGKEIENTQNYCKYCGARNELAIDTCTALVLKFKAGEEDAFDEIYCETYSTVLKIVRSFFPEDAEECEDCIQDIYMNFYEKAWQYDPEKGEFLPWFKKMVRNICSTRYQKKKSNQKKTMSMDHMMISGESDENIEFEEERLEFNPEASIDRQETHRLIQAILDEIPEQQKQCLLLYYAAEYKQEDIAEMLGIPKGTVKSRLYNGKKLVEEKVLELEKRGTKLYGMSPVAFFIWLFGKENNGQGEYVFQQGEKLLQQCKNAQVKTARVNTETVASKTTKTSAQVSTNTKAAAGANVAAGAKTMGAKAVAAKVIATVVGAAVIGSGGYYVVQNFQEKQQESAVKQEEYLEENINLEKLVDEEYVASMLQFLPEMEEMTLEVAADAIYDLACYQWLYLTKETIIEEELKLLEGFPEVTEVTRDRDLGNGSNIFMKKDDLGKVLDIYGIEYSWEQLQEQNDKITYVDDEKVGFQTIYREGNGGTVTINSKKTEEDALMISYGFRNELSGIHLSNLSAKILPADNSLGYYIAEIVNLDNDLEFIKYADLRKAYDDYYYKDGAETEGILTEEIINQQQYGILNPYHGYPFDYSVVQEELSYGLTDINNDGYKECIITSYNPDMPVTPEQMGVYDIWTRNESGIAHVLSGGYRSFVAFCEDGTIMEYGSAGYDMGGYRWLSFDNEGNITEVDHYYFDSENPLDENIVNQYKEKHKIVDKQIDFKTSEEFLD